MNSSHIAVAYFANTKAEEVYSKLTNEFIVGYSIESSSSSITKSICDIFDAKPLYIIGLGEYSGRDQHNLRLETLCNCKWRNETLYNFTKTKIKPLFPQTTTLKYSEGHGNSYCNYLSLLALNQRRSIPYNFIHIPKQFDSNAATLEISQQLQSLNFSQAAKWV